MRQRPVEFTVLAAALVVIAASLPIQVMLYYGHLPSELQSSTGGLAPLNWLVIFGAIIHAVFVFEASPMVLLSTPLFVGLVGWNNWVVARTGLNYPMIIPIIATIGAAMIHFPLFRERAAQVLLNPKLRWWRTPFRKRATVHAVIRPVLGGEVRLQTFDISTGGAFIPLDGSNWVTSLSVPFKHLQVGARCSVRLTLSQLQVVQCNAEVVRHAVPRGEYPTGFAVRFVCLDGEQKRILTEFIEKENAVDKRVPLMAA